MNMYKASKFVFKRLQHSIAAPQINPKEKSVELVWKDTKSIFHYSWLRDSCTGPKSIHSSTRQKLHSSGHIINPTPKNICWKDNSLFIIWNKNSLKGPGRGHNEEEHQSKYDLEWLLENDYSKPPKKLITPVLWDAKIYTEKYKPIDYSVFANTADGLNTALMRIRDYGLCFLRNVPIGNQKQVELVAKRIGIIKDTFYGMSWDVKSVPDSKNIAYTSLQLGLHMDLMYFESPPGLQFLHCLENTVTGGESFFLDVFKAVEILKVESPEHYEILQRVPVTFHYNNDGHHMHFQRPTIVENDLNDGVKVYYAPPFQGPLQVAPEMVDDFYKAFAHFESIIARPELIFKKLLKPNECVIFANQRVLHGRDSFDAGSGGRHLRGTYVGWDEFKDKLRVEIKKGTIPHY